MSARWPLAPVLLVRARDELEASVALADACVLERTREAEHAAVAEALAACSAERFRVESEPGPVAAGDRASAARRVAALREREAALGLALGSAAAAREEAAGRVSAARTALAAARRARELLEGRREAFVRAARARAEEREAAEASAPRGRAG